ncbi:uncharacterized protein N7484_003012 [Penicillium longicatenatum]|uniref:uncharacterized protein n=1 Tax=Penicillium longicatenatum TaxID=1561947 RepID=UPI002546E253|nr:uncharacterized protein N7484_003012 [Penicillium longicatenatum]KAJ5649289.1 hypothetical protein N7484_003012 [Penicillium longicatenatum]
MSFHESGSNIEVEHGHILKAALRYGEDEERDAEIDLNDFIGNDDGHFCWGGQNFEESARSIEFSMEGDGTPVLRAKLINMEGEEVDADINLAERIANENGEFVFV